MRRKWPAARAKKFHHQDGHGGGGEDDSKLHHWAKCSAMIVHYFVNLRGTERCAEHVTRALNCRPAKCAAISAGVSGQTKTAVCASACATARSRWPTV